VVLSDLTEQRASDLRFRALFENTRDAIAVADGDVVIWVNAAFGWIMGAADPESLIGRKIHELVAPESRDTLVRQREQRVPGHIEPSVYTIRMMRSDGTTFDAEIRASTFNAGSGPQSVAFVRDITAERAAEEALRFSEARFRSLFDQSPVSTQIFSPDGTPGRANRAWCDLFGVTLEQIAGYNILHDPQLVEAGIMPLIERAFGGEAVFLPEIRYVTATGRRQGEVLWIEAVMYPVLDGNGVVREVVLLHQDVTAHKHTQQHLVAQAQELARSNADLQQFAYIASHDLQEPLRVLSTFSALLSRRYSGQLDAEALKYLDFMTTAAQRMSDLVRDILAYSSVNSADEAPSDVDLNLVLQSVLHSLQTAADAAGAHIETCPLPVVRGNGVQLSQLLLNLVSNAIKYRKQDVPPVVRISVVDEPTEWILEVDDNGIGIAPESQERIFGMFKRLHSREYPGTGIGLAIARRIAEAHGGRITVHSAEGQGSTFRVHLPRCATLNCGAGL
jgi:PAS domain S-box-containing protein